MTARKSVAPFYAVAVLWLAYGLVLPLYRPVHFVILILTSAAVMAVVNALCKNAAEGTEEKSAETAEKPKTETTGNPELDKMIKDGALAISEMKRLDAAIEDAGISADIVRLEQVSSKIFEEVKADPKKLPQIRRFMDYYLPTTLKLLNAMTGPAPPGSPEKT